MAFVKKVLILIIPLIIASLYLHSQNLNDTIVNKYSTDTTFHIEAITVEAYLQKGGLRTLTGSLSVLVGEELSMADGTSLATSLNTLPGLTMQSGTYATNRIVIRGMGSRTPYNTNRIKAYLNDIPITSSDGISTPEEFDLLGLGRIEVIKGPASAIYGSGLGGSISLYTPTKEESQLSGLVQYGSYNTGKANVSGNLITENSSIWTSISQIRSDGYRENNNFNSTSILSMATWGRQNRSVSATIHLLDVNAGIPSSLGRTQFENNPQQAAANWNAIEGYKAYSKGLLGITYSSKINSNLTNKLILFGRINNSYEKRPFNNLDDGSVSGGLRNKLTYHTNKSDLVIGTELIIDTYKWAIEKDEILQNKNRERRNQINIFGLIHHRLNEKFIATLALAANHIGYSLTDQFLADGDSSGRRNFPVIFSPRVGFNYAPNYLFAVYASAGHGFSLPSPEETLLPEGNVNPDIKPEQGWQFEIGTRLTPKNRIIEAEFTFYWIELNNLILTKRISEDIFTGINAGNTRHQGIEIQMRNQILKLRNFPGKISTMFSYYQSLNRFINFIDDGVNLSGNHLPGIPNQTFQLLIDWKPYKDISFNIHLQQQGNQYLTDNNSAYSPGFIIGNIKLSSPIPLKFRGSILLYLGINNFTNTHYASMVVPNAIGFGNTEPRYYYPGLPRHFYGGIRIGF